MSKQSCSHYCKEDSSAHNSKKKSTDDLFNRVVIQEISAEWHQRSKKDKACSQGKIDLCCMYRNVFTEYYDLQNKPKILLAYKMLISVTIVSKQMQSQNVLKVIHSLQSMLLKVLPEQNTALREHTRLVE